MGHRIILTSFGSLGDVNPYLGLAEGLRRRGHDPVIATSAYYRQMVERQGFEFHPVRPDVDPTDRDTMERIMDPLRGTEVIIRDLLMPHLRESYEDLSAAVRGADALITHPITFAGPVVAAETRVPWISTVLAPMSFVSAHDVPVFAPVPWLHHFGRLGSWAGKLVTGMARLITRSWSEPVYRLRRGLGLPRGGDPLYEGQHSPELVLALFSRVLAEPQPDWPDNVIVTGPIFHDADETSTGTGGSGESVVRTRMSDQLRSFLEEGPPPAVVTLGSAAVHAAGDFYRESLEAVRHLGIRAVLLTGHRDDHRLSGDLPEGVIAEDFAPHSEVFPRASVIVHQGGIGTTSQALRAGQPSLVVPFSHDQFDNAYRLRRLGLSETLYRSRYRAHRAELALHDLLGDPKYRARAQEAARTVQAEDGVGTACRAIEAHLSG